MTDDLTIYTVYNGPADHAEAIVVRPFVVRPGGAIEPLDSAEYFLSIEEARTVLGRRGLFQLARHPDDDPAIVETWF